MDAIHHGGQVWLPLPIVCEIWWLLDFGFYDACTMILAWASFERHILIIHSNLVATKRRLIFSHYLPLVIIPAYLSIFFIYAIFFPPCENEYDFTLPACGGSPCYATVWYLVQLDTIFHGIISTFLIAFFNVVLLIRILWQKHCHRQNWKKMSKNGFSTSFNIYTLSFYESTIDDYCFRTIHWLS